MSARTTPITVPTNCTGTIMPFPRGGFVATINGSGNLVYAANFVNLPLVAYSGEIDRQKQAADIRSVSATKTK